MNMLFKVYSSLNNLLFIVSYSYAILRSVSAKFHYASCFEAGRRQIRSQIPLRYLVRTSSEPTSVMDFGFKYNVLLL